MLVPVVPKGQPRPAEETQWRQRIREFLTSKRSARVAYLKTWRRVKKDGKLKKVPGYFELAKARKVDTSLLSTPRERCNVEALAQTTNVMTPEAVLNMTKSLKRTQFRKDGLIPTMGQGCANLFFRMDGEFVTSEQLLLLTGFCPELQGRAMEIAKNLPTADLDMMVGHSMCLPAIGTVLAHAFQLLDITG